MRIIAGAAKGRKLRSLQGRALRPTADRVRESLFATLADQVVGAVFADLFAGVGTVGLEALSRGARRAVFVESHPPAARLILANAALCGFADRIHVITAPLARALPLLARKGTIFDLVFLDPPYAARGAKPVPAGPGFKSPLAGPPACVGSPTDLLSQALGLLARLPCLLSDHAEVICQHSRLQVLPDRISLTPTAQGCLARKKQSRFGETVLDFYHRAGPGQASDEGGEQP